MIGLSWPLWVDGDDFPRVPFLRGWPDWPAWCSRVLLAVIAGSLAMAALGRAWRAGLALGLAGLAVATLGDQDRLQPWAYQFGLLDLAMVSASKPRALALGRMSAIGLYAYSGLSKLDVSFATELGPTFLAAGLGLVGASPTGWPGWLRTTAILAMPAWEVAVALGLGFRRTRRLALFAAIAQHSALLAILGPWSLGHSPNVLVWNGAMIVEDWLLFANSPGGPAASDRERWPGRLASLVVVVALILPAGERSGLFDSWPSHALYASHCERTEILAHEDDAERFPEAIRRRLGPADLDGWRRLDLTGWSRDVRGVPIYPQGRVGSGIAEALAARWGGVHPLRVIQWGRADPVDGRRPRVECVGLRAIRRRGGRYWVNAHPSGPGRTAP